MIALSTMEMKGLTIMLATAAEARSLTRRAKSLPRSPMLWKKSKSRPGLPAARWAKKPRAAEAAVAAVAAVAAAATVRWCNRGAVGAGNLWQDRGGDTVEERKDYDMYNTSKGAVLFASTNVFFFFSIALFFKSCSCCTVFRT